MSWQDRVKGWVHDENNIKGFFGDYRWLSNFHSCPVTYDGMNFPSSEAAYQAAKCIDRKDRRQFQMISAVDAKKLGRKVKIRPDWGEIKLGVMKEVLQDKFLKNPGLRKQLEETGERYLEETNWWNDRFWGVSYGHGNNHLGKIIMEIRDAVEVA